MEVFIASDASNNESNHFAKGCVIISVSIVECLYTYIAGTCRYTYS